MSNKKQNQKVGRKKIKATTEQLKEAQRLYQKSASLREVAQYLNVSAPTVSRIFKENGFYVDTPTVERKHNSTAPFTDEENIPTKTLTMDLDNFTHSNLYGKHSRVLKDVEAQLIKIRSLETLDSVVIQTHNLRTQLITKTLMTEFRKLGFTIATDKAFSGDVIPHHFKRTHALKENITAPIKEKVYRRAEILKHHLKHKLNSVEYMRIYNDEIRQHNQKNGGELLTQTKEILKNINGAVF
jgi:transcriptional regulator with XRE-family HTH domain